MKTPFVQACGKTVITVFAIANLLQIHTARAQSEATNAQALTGQLPTQPSASNGLRANVHVIQSPLKFNINFENPQGGVVHVRILNERRKVLYMEVFSKTYKKGTLYDLSSLEDGTYTFEISTTTQKYAKTFLIQTTTARTATSLESQQPADEIGQVIQ